MSIRIQHSVKKVFQNGMLFGGRQRLEPTDPSHSVHLEVREPKLATRHTPPWRYRGRLYGVFQVHESIVVGCLP